MLAFQNMTPTKPHLRSKIDNVPAPVDISIRDELMSIPSAPPRHMRSSLAPPISTKRPKLSLQTSSLPVTFGNSSTTALAITASAKPTASPTVLNTFNNAYDIPHRLSPANASPSGTRAARPSSRVVSPYIVSRGDRSYILPLGVKGILRNAPMSSTLRGASTCTNSASPRSSRRIFFPVAKKVGYRSPLAEEIRTVKFIARHSDLSSEESEKDYGSEETSEDSEESSRHSASEEDNDVNHHSRKRRKTKVHRQVEAAASRDGLKDREKTSQRPEPRHSSRRRKRQWEWTLGPLNEAARGSMGVQELSSANHYRPRKPELSLDTSSVISLEASFISMPAEKTPYAYPDHENHFPSPSRIALPKSSLESPVSWSPQTKGGMDEATDSTKVEIMTQCQDDPQTPVSSVR